MKKTKIILVMMAFAVLIKSPTWAQQRTTDHIPCYFDELMDEHLKKSKSHQNEILEMNKKISDYLDGQALMKGGSTGTLKSLNQNAALIIPVVVYVVHENGPENITDIQVMSQIDALNNYYDPLGIQFCLATKKGSEDLITMNSPSGVTSATPGIFHYYSPLLTNHNVAQEPTLKAISSALPAENYLRIWVVKGISSNTLPPGEVILGYSSFPDFGAPALDGIVMTYSAFGDVSSCACTNLAPYSQDGKILVHETGHYFNLYHTFQGSCMGMNSSTCSLEGDFVCDTPPVSAPNTGCPASSWNTCAESPDLPDDINNYMDYVSESCMTDFTSGQVDRILAGINLFRSNLVSTPNLVYTGISCTGGLFANFAYTQTGTCIGATVSFTAVAVPGATYSWDFGDGATGTGQTVSHTYTGAYMPASVVLTVDNGSNSASSTQMVFIEDCEPIESEQGIWYFGQRGGMDFSSGSPVYNNQSYIHGNYIDEACAVQGDAQGNLLFYTSGEKVWDSNHATINASNLLKSDLSAHHGAIIVPHPGNSNQYYIFTKDGGVYGAGGQTTVSGLDGFRYSIVDISTGSALPTTQWNIAIAPASMGYLLGSDGAMRGGEGITTAVACDGYWILTTGIKTDGYYITKFKLSSSGLVFHSEQAIPFNCIQTSLKVSPDGSRLAVGSGTCGSLETSGLQVYDFDSYTGALSNPIWLNNYKTYGFMFSPDSKLLYTSHWNSNAVLQYDLNAVSPSTSALFVTNSTANDMQLGPDNKIYMSNGTNYVSVIHQPNIRNTTSNPNACMYSAFGPQMQIATSCMPNLMNATEENVFENAIEASPVNCLTYLFSATICSGMMNWNFGDPGSGAANTSTLSNPSHSFSAPGTYTVTLTVGSITTSQLIEVGINAEIYGSATVCTSQTMTGNYSTVLQPGHTALWSVNGGGIAGLDNQQDVTVIWTSLPGTVTLTISDEDAGCSVTEVLTIVDSCITQPPCSCQLSASFSTTLSPQNCSASFAASISDATWCTEAISYTWDFGDGTTGTGMNASHTYAGSGSYQVCLTVMAFNGTDYCETTSCQTIQIQCPSTSGCACDYELDFGFGFNEENCTLYLDGYIDGNTCPDEYIEYIWDFGDGTTSNTQSPSHIYSQPGWYGVCLTAIVYDMNGERLCDKQVCKEIEIKCAGDCPCELKPVIKYDVDEKTCTYSFDGMHGGPECLTNVQYFWDFGDGTTAYGQSPDHVYMQPGSYDVCLTVTVYDNNGERTCEDKVCIKVDVECKGECECKLAPNMKIELDKETCYYTFTGFHGGPECLQFVEYFWDFGDGTTSIGQVAGHVYSQTGTYEVCLYVEVKDENGDRLCSKKICKEVKVTCKGDCDCKLEPSYSLTPLGSCEFLFTANPPSPCANIKDMIWVVNGQQVAQGSYLVQTMNINESYEVCLHVLAYTDGEECEEKYCDKFFFTDCYPSFRSHEVTTELQEGALDATLFPNPAQGAFSIQFSERIETEVHVVLKSIDGKLLKEETLSTTDANVYTISIPEAIGNGLIIVEVTTGDKQFTKKLLVMRK